MSSWLGVITNSIRLAPCGTQIRTFGPYLAAIDRILISVTRGWLAGRRRGVCWKGTGWSAAQVVETGRCWHR
jgi:hypothetical protein